MSIEIMDAGTLLVMALGGIVGNTATITVGEIKAETGGVAAAKIDAPNSRFGGSDTNISLGKI